MKNPGYICVKGFTDSEDMYKYLKNARLFKWVYKKQWPLGLLGSMRGYLIIKNTLLINI